MKEIIEKTMSVCPECLKDIPAVLTEEGGSIYIEKTCEAHGYFKAVVSKYAWYYKELNRFYELLASPRHVFSDSTIENFQLFSTGKCDLNCNICYAGSSSDNGDLSLEEIDRMLKSIKKPHRRISILGGEPTMREDLNEIIRAIVKNGHKPLLFTHGLKIADIEYLRSLKKAGLNNIGVWIDTLSRDRVYEKIRGRKLVEEKRRVLHNLKLLKMPTRLIMVLVRGVNEGEIGEVVEFARQNDFVSTLNIRGYSNIGKKIFSCSEEFAADELVEIVSKETGGLFSLEEFFLFQKLVYIFNLVFRNKPVCWQEQSIYIPRGKNKKIRDVLDLRRFGKIIGEFENIFRDSPCKAKIYFLGKNADILLRHPVFSYWMGMSKFFKDRSRYLELTFMKFYTPHTYDHNKIMRRCRECWLPSYFNKDAVDFCTYLVKFSDNKGPLNAGSAGQGGR